MKLQLWKKKEKKKADVVVLPHPEYQTVEVDGERWWVGTVTLDKPFPSLKK